MPGKLGDRDRLLGLLNMAPVKPLCTPAVGARSRAGRVNDHCVLR